MEKKIFLSIETSLNRIFLVLSNKKRFFVSEKLVNRSIEVDLNILLKELFKKAEVAFNNLDLVLVSLGPGSFTGTRVGISAAKAISSALDIELLGYSNFYAIYNQAKKLNVFCEKKDIDILIQATKFDFYHQNYSTEKCKFGDMKVLNKEEIKIINERNSYKVGISNILQRNRNFTQISPGIHFFNQIISNYNPKSFFRDSDLFPLYIKEHYAKKKHN